MAAPSFEDLLTVPTQDEVLNQEVLPELQRRGLRTTDWNPGAELRKLAYVVALLRANDRLSIATIMAAGFEDYVFGKSVPPADAAGNVADVTGWAPVISVQRYGTPQIEATYTRRRLTLTNTATGSYGPLQPGAASLMVQFPSGNRYVLDEVTTIAAAVGVTPGITLALFRSEFASDSDAGLVYNDSPGTTPLTLITANYPGVSVSNPPPLFSTVAHAGTGLGTVTPSGTPTPVGALHSIAVRIMTSGNAGVAGWQYAFDGGAWSATQLAAVVVIGSGITVTLADNGGNPAFVFGEVYYFTTPGSDVVQVGADIESPGALGARCRGLIPAIAFPQDDLGRWIPTSPTASGYETLVRNANANVRVVLVQTDTTINNKVNIVIAGNGGAALSPVDVANMQQFLDAFSMETDLPNVSTSTPRAIVLAGLVVSCKSAQLVSAQTTLTQRLQKYLGGLDPFAPISINPFIDYDYIVSLARTTPGVTRLDGTLTINGGTTDLQLPITVGAFESATWAQTAANAFTWATS
jgi:hypothetical protein